MSSVGGSYYVEKWQKGSRLAKKWKNPQKRGRRQNKGKVDPQERRKDRPSFLLLALPTCQTQIHLNISPFGLLGSKCSSTCGEWGKTMFTLSKALSSTWVGHLILMMMKTLCPCLAVHNTVEPKCLMLHSAIHLWMSNKGSVSWCWWRLFVHVWRFTIQLSQNAWRWGNLSKTF